MVYLIIIQNLIIFTFYAISLTWAFCSKILTRKLAEFKLDSACVCDSLLQGESPRASSIKALLLLQGPYTGLLHRKLAFRAQNPFPASQAGVRQWNSFPSSKNVLLRAYICTACPGVKFLKD